MNKDILINEEIKSIKDIKTESNGLIVFVKPQETKKLLMDLVKVHENLHVTRENLKESKKVREIIRQPRYDLQNIQKSNKVVLNVLKKSFQELTDEFIKITRPLENEIDDKIKLIEKQIKDEKEAEKRKAEQKRNEINDKILKWSQKMPQIYENCISLRNSDEMKKSLEDLKSEIESGLFELQVLKADEIHGIYLDKFPGLEEKIRKSIEQDELNKQVQDRQDKLDKQILENYSVLLETIEILKGDKSLFIKEKPTYEDFEIVKNEIKRLRSPEELEKPELDVPEDGAIKPNDEFEKPNIEGVTADDAINAMRDLGKAINKNNILDKMDSDDSDYIEETKQLINFNVQRCATSFIFHDRLDDPNLTIDRLKQIIESKEVSIQYIVEIFENQIIYGLKELI